MNSHQRRKQRRGRVHMTLRMEELMNSVYGPAFSRLILQPSLITLDLARAVITHESRV